MKGKYFIEVWNKKVKFRLDIDRQISVIRGNSSTGKSYFVQLVQTFYSKSFTGVKLKTDFKNISVYTKVNSRYLEEDLKKYRETLFILEEDIAFARTKEFAEYVKGSDNYFILVNREDFPYLPYSIMSIYEFESKKTITDGRVYTNTTMRSMYTDREKHGMIKPDILLVEDSGSGLKFFENSLNCSVDTSGSNSNMLNKILEVLSSGEYSNVVAVVDGAAFGCYISAMSNYLEESKYDVTMFIPESFEHLILGSGVFKGNDLISKLLK